MINIFTRVAVLSTVGSLSLLGGACTSPSATPPPCEGGACLDADTSSAADSGLRDTASGDGGVPPGEAPPAPSNPTTRTNRSGAPGDPPGSPACVPAATAAWIAAAIPPAR